jgi:8-oxo-dGTP pyrophosphatase MutT (NUDIX family)
VSASFRTARAVLVRDGKALLAVHGHRGPRKWGLPGGRIERRESPEAALVRELEEELDLRLAHSQLHEVGAFTWKRALHQVFAVRIELDIHTFDRYELAEIGWFGADAIDELATASALHTGWEPDAVRRALEILHS